MGSVIAESPLENVFEPGLEHELLKYPGKWTAVTETEVVAVGDTPREVLEAAIAKGVTKVTLHRVPDESNKAYFF